MPKKPNYDFEKRRKELDRKAKKDGRREEKRLRRERSAGAGESTTSGSTTDAITDAAPGTPDAGSPDGVRR